MRAQTCRVLKVEFLLHHSQLIRVDPPMMHTLIHPGKRGIGFRSLHEALDTTTPGGRLVSGIESVRDW
jgi:hypothetical protein